MGEHRAGRARARRYVALLVVSLAAGLLPVMPSAMAAAVADPCAPGSNPIVCENSKPGIPAAAWDIQGVGDPSIQGFATDMSVDVGDTIGFKVHTDATAYQIQILRLGWYGGAGARVVDTLTPSAALPQTQPGCLYEDTSGLIDCGNWALSGSWNVPADAVSGIYLARLYRPDTGGASHIVFVVRDDASHSDMVFQTSDTTWQAYNQYGGNSLYHGAPWGRALKVSYNRPFTVRFDTPDGRDSVFGSEYAMVRWLERNGYDVSYISGIDTDRHGTSLLGNHDVFLSVGHDEYWSGPQRANVEAARDAGMDLAFISGNEVFWRTRWENSIDGSGTPYRTLVTYKETHQNARVDPSGEWTGTWRDPRFLTGTDDVEPENSLTGSLFTVMCCTYGIEVPAEYGDLRFWRNTAVADLEPGQVAELPWGTLGYEWNEDIDNEFRPPGAFRMSETTETVERRLIDFGTETEVAEATHHLMTYRAASGALVWSTGTTQWSWGLDAYHDGPKTDTSDIMRQATVNVFADMGAQPATLQSGLVPAMQSTDTTGPTVAITTPAAGDSLERGGGITVAGTAADTGGGVVAGVEVSLDGGVHWHRAEGRDTWTFEGGVNIIGPLQVRARGVDDTGNIGATTTIGVEITCPCQIFSNDDIPAVAAYNDPTSVELGVKFRTDADGWIQGVRFYKGPGNTGTHVGSLWSATGDLLARATFANETATGWQQVIFTEPVPVTAGTTYVASYHAPNGHYPGDTDWFLAGSTASPPLRALANGTAGPNGVYRESGSPAFPTSSYRSRNYWVDVVFNQVAGPDTWEPHVMETSPAAGAWGAGTAGAVTAEFNEAIDPETLEFTLTAGSAPVPGVVGYDAATLTASFQPDQSLQQLTDYTATVSASDIHGNAMTAPEVFTFTTGFSSHGVAVLWDQSQRPVNVNDSDTQPLTLGVKFTSDVAGSVTGVRFYKGSQNTGTHVGSLWSSSGTLLAQAAFVDESPDGWQQVLFSQPVPIQAGVTYVASYHTPTARFSADRDYFTSDHVNGPLRAPASGTSGGNGVYAYGASPTFPLGTSGAANYWVTPVVEPGGDDLPIAVMTTSPARGTFDVPVGATVSVTFDSPADPESVEITVADGASEVPGEVSLGAAGTVATFTPDGALAEGTTFTATVTAADLAGNAMEVPHTFTFTTVLAGSVVALWEKTALPADVNDSDTQPLTLGVKFTSATAGSVTGLRFYKGAQNTGTHVGSLWSSSGTLLAEATFTDESADGWQQVLFSEPVTIQPGVTYVASYHSPTGKFSATRFAFYGPHVNGPLTAPSSSVAGGNGVYVYGASPAFPSASTPSAANYWVTPLVDGADAFPPHVASTAPADGELEVGVDRPITVTFDEPVAPASLEVSVAAGGAVAGTVTLSPDGKVATFAHTTALAAGVVHTVTVTASDLVGNTMDPYVFSFTTEPEGDVVALWDLSAVPAVIDDSDTQPLTLGVKFTSATAGSVTGLRFYKGAQNTGTHVGSLWSSSGTLLAEATFTDESADGWQQVLFSEPVTIQPGVTYVASYHSPTGKFSATRFAFYGPHVNGPLTAPSSSVAGGNGVYVYGASPAFPSASTPSAANYWVTPLFHVSADTLAPEVVSTAPADGAAHVAPGAAITATFSEEVAAASVGIAVAGPSGAVPGTVATAPGGLSATFAPTDALAGGAEHTVTVTASDPSGNAMDPHVFSFSTELSSQSLAVLWDQSVRPVNIDDSDTQPLTLGVKFTSDVAGSVTGVRFYKGSQNTGTHVGSLWSASGALLAEATFVDESADGWQQVLFSAPVPIQAGVTYVASYHSPTSRFSADRNYFTTEHVNGPLRGLASGASGGNGVYAYGASPTFPSGTSGAANYWVTPVVEPGDDTVAPSVVSTSPADGADDADRSEPVSVTFDEPVDETVTLVVSAGAQPVTGTVEVSGDGRTVTFTPASILSPATAYEVTVAAEDLAGNAMDPHQFSFTTAPLPVHALWEMSAVPSVVNDSDTQPLTLGVKFTSDVAGSVTGVRFYKGSQNTGTHVGSLWSASGALLAEATFVDESADGWQQVLFSEPVPIQAGVTYVASYHTPTGKFSANRNYFTAEHVHGPLRGLASGPSGGNGVYAYGATSTYPSGTSGAANYWVTPVVATGEGE